MKKLFAGFTAMVLIALLAAPATGETTLTLKLEVERVGMGNEYNVDVYALVEGTGPDKGLADTQFTIATHNSTGLTEPVEKYPPPSSGQVEMTWDPRIVNNFGVTLDAVYTDVGGDGDQDAFQAAFSDLNDFQDMNVGVGDWALLATETWQMYVDSPVWLDIDVHPSSRHYDLDLGADPWKREFDEVIGQGAWAGIPEPGTVALLLAGAALLVGSGRRRRGQVG